MADNRNFVNKFANEGGGDIFVEDARLSESTSTTTVTTEGFMLKGTDGAYYEIDKASLSEVIRAELGNILADNSKNNGTSVGKVPTLNSTGNALGASSVADLATVLGAIAPFNTVIGRISFPYGVSAFSGVSLGFQIVTTDGSGCEMAFQLGGTGIRFRMATRNSWGEWQTLK